ncbi:hypothetical protein TNCV_3997181 [Trichonephila clavipes]|nr:hypothetical protein TNCV_3997181 [Trichonephila clavipes]
MVFICRRGYMRWPWKPNGDGRELLAGVVCPRSGGNVSTEGMPCQGHPSTGKNYENIDKIKCVIDENRRNSIGQISEGTNVSWSSFMTMLQPTHL